MANYSFISQLIFGILVKHGSLYLPTVGCLNCVRVAASLSDNGQDFIPPRYIVEYNNSVDENSLVDIIADQQGLPVSDSKQIYDSWLSLIAEHLDGGIRYSIEDVGVLYVYAEGSAMFVIDDTLALYLNPFLGDREAEAYAKEPYITQAASTNSTLSKEAPPSAAEFKRAAYPPKQRSKAMARRDFIRFFLLLLVVFVAIGVAFVAANYRTYLAGAMAYLEPLDVTEITILTPEVSKIAVVSSRKDDSTALDAVEKELKNVDNTQPFSVEEAAQKKVAQGGQALLYHVVAGSFKSEALANKYSKLYGSSSVIYNKHSGFYLVVVFSAKSRNKANCKIDELPYIKYPYGYWVWEQKK